VARDPLAQRQVAFAHRVLQAVAHRAQDGSVGRLGLRDREQRRVGDASGEGNDAGTVEDLQQLAYLRRRHAAGATRIVRFPGMRVRLLVHGFWLPTFQSNYVSVADLLASARLPISANLCSPDHISTACPAAAVPPEVSAPWEGGAGRPGSRPLASDRIARGTKNALLGHFRRPRGAWMGLSTMPCGVSELDFAAPGLTATAQSRGAPASAPNPVRRFSRARWRSDGLSAMPADAPDCGPRLLA
jgi:hypothetical protein